MDSILIFNPRLKQQPTISPIQYEVINRLNKISHKINLGVLMFALDEWNKDDSAIFKGLNRPNPESESHTSRYELNLTTLLTALLLSDHDFYLPHKIDFRGRVYPATQFSYQLGDLGRALFASHHYPLAAQHAKLMIKAGINYFGASKVQSYFDNNIAINEIKDVHLASEPFLFKGVQLALDDFMKQITE
jgi:hypothetical protein